MHVEDEIKECLELAKQADLFFGKFKPVYGAFAQEVVDVIVIYALTVHGDEA